ncbi:MAG: DegT/DnrJ/EryC1/StrS family aminotransferase [Candidatus Omnitrophota bacterium]
MTPTRNTFLMFGSPEIGRDEINEVVATMKSGWLGTGPKASDFEKMFKKYIGSKYAIALSSCTAGLHLSLVVAGVKPKDEIITTPMTFVSTANVIVHTGAIPVFADVKKDTMNIDPAKIERKITKRTKAIIPVHLAGRSCDMDAILKIAKKHKLIVINDAAHAIEAEYNGRKIGALGDMACFSFYTTKNIIACEGGMLTTSNREYADKIKTLALYGLSRGAWERFSDRGYKHYFVTCAGFKYNMTDLQASIGIHQLKKIEKKSKKRRNIWLKYNNAFKDLPCSIPAQVENNTRHAFHLYTLLVDIDRLKTSRDGIINALYKENIGTGIHYTSLHLHPFYAKTFGYKRGDFPNAEFISDRTISLPLSPKLTDKDVADVITAVRKVLNHYKR